MTQFLTMGDEPFWQNIPLPPIRVVLPVIRQLIIRGDELSQNIPPPFTIVNPSRIEDFSSPFRK